MFSEVSQDVEQLLKFCAGNIAERWAVLNGLPGEEALQCVTWQLKRQWSFTAAPTCGSVSSAPTT